MANDVIRLRYAGTCSVCGTALAASTKAHWDTATKLITCLACRGHDGARAANRNTSGSAGTHHAR